MDGGKRKSANDFSATFPSRALASPSEPEWTWGSSQSEVISSSFPPKKYFSAFIFLRSELSAIGVSSSILSKLEPYLGLETEAAVYGAVLDPTDLRLTLDEALELDSAFNRDLHQRISPYDDNLSERGRAVLASISHWCYNVVDNTADDKCYLEQCENYLRNALLGKTVISKLSVSKKYKLILKYFFARPKATDADLKSALESQLVCATANNRSDFVLNRLRGEIAFLEG